MDAGDDTPWDVLTRHFSGTSSPEDDAALARWIERDPSRAEFVRALRTRWDASARLPQRHDAAAAWERVQRRLAESGDRTPQVRDRSVFTLHRSPSATPLRVWGVRAAALAAAAVLGAMYARRPDSPRPALIEPAPALPAMREYATVAGQRADIRLPDGSRVVLAPETILRVPATIGDTAAAREVTLVGRAFFDVVHDARRPFAVRTASGIARDVGTSFEVHAYDRARRMQVTVVSGVVTLETTTSAQPPATLRRGDRATLGDSGALTVAHGVNTEAAAAWTQGRLVFTHTPLGEVALELSRWYDLDIRLADSAIANRRLVLSLKDEPASDALDAIALSLALRVERRGRVVTLYPLDSRSP